MPLQLVNSTVPPVSGSSATGKVVPYSDIDKDSRATAQGYIAYVHPPDVDGFRGRGYTIHSVGESVTDSLRVDTANLLYDDSHVKR